jgi:molecular chaperone DnaJ
MDFYAVLNVAPSASPGEIERAYRRLLRRYHPGINPGDRLAEDVYRRIQEAYAVLSNAARRQGYDEGPAALPSAGVETTIAFEGFDFSAEPGDAEAATFSELFADVFQGAARRAAAPERGADVEQVLTVSFEDAMRGGAVPMSLLRQDRCATCRGAGSVPSPHAPCPSCEGQGTLRAARGHMVFAKPCERCDGTGRVVRQACRVCQGAGVHPRSEVVTVAVPPGVEDGSRLVVPGRGHAGAHGGPAGDLYATVSVTAHPYFRREGRDLLLTLPVSVHEAGLGARVDVPTLAGLVKWRIPPGTSSGQRFRLRARGSGDARPAGDLVVEVQIVLPPIRDERSKELLREFGRLNDVDVRRQLFSDRS